MNELIKEIYDLKGSKEALEKQIENLKAALDNLQKQIDEKSDILLTDMLNEGLKEQEADGLFAIAIHRRNVKYADEDAIMDILKNKFDGKYVKIKTTESIDKVPLKKALKTDNTLATALDGHLIDSYTDYVIVTDAANREKILEHLK